MTPYKSSNRRTSILGYESGEDYIIVEFKNGNILKYSYDKSGQKHVDTMKRYAKYASGLSSYIKLHQPAYEEIRLGTTKA